MWEENGGESYSPNVAYLAHFGEGEEGGSISGAGFFFSYFPPLKPRCILWSGESYSPKNMVDVFSMAQDCLTLIKLNK